MLCSIITWPDSHEFAILVAYPFLESCLHFIEHFPSLIFVWLSYFYQIHKQLSVNIIYEKTTHC
jgi:hypothetical protein